MPEDDPAWPRKLLRRLFEGMIWNSCAPPREDRAAPPRSSILFPGSGPVPGPGPRRPPGLPRRGL